MSRKARLYGDTASVVRPVLKLRPVGAKRRGPPRSCAPTSAVAPNRDKPLPIAELVLAPWRAAERHGYTEAQWRALAQPSAALRDLIALLNPKRLPLPAKPWPDTMIAAMKRLASTRTGGNVVCMGCRARGRLTHVEGEPARLRKRG